MREFKIQKEFLDSIRGVSPHFCEETQVYEKLLFLRFYDVLSGSFPIFTQLITQPNMENLVKQFIKANPTTPFIASSANEFLNFLKEHKLVVSKKELEIMDFELSELKLYLNTHRLKQSRFTWNKRVKLAKTAHIKALSYRVVENRPSIKEQNYYILHQDRDDKEVYHFEITKFLYHFIKLLKTNPTHKAFQIVKKRYNLDSKESKAIFEDGLISLTQRGILI